MIIKNKSSNPIKSITNYASSTNTNIFIYSTITNSNNISINKSKYYPKLTHKLKIIILKV